jgi:tRNA1(Val) A37 N6-methylase TrmN6
MIDYTNDYLLDKKVKIFQPVNGYRASTDAVLLSSLVRIKTATAF